MSGLPIAQTGPTCGIYALINGLCSMSDIQLKKSDADKIVYDLLYKQFYCHNHNETFIGEFFDICNFTKFIKKHINYLSQKIGVDIKQYKVYISKIDKLKEQSFQNKLINKELFVLFSYHSNGNEDHSVNHWIAICDYKKNKFIALNSTPTIINCKSGKRKKYTIDKLIKKNEKLKDKVFDWNKYNKLKPNCVTSEYSEKIIHLLKNRFNNKYKYLNKGKLKEKIVHQDGYMIVVSSQ